MQNCPICNFKLKRSGPTDKDSYFFDCYCCGSFLLSSAAFHDMNLFDKDIFSKSKISGWIRRHPKETLTSDKIKTILSFPTPSVFEKANSLLLYLSDLFPIPGQVFDDIYNKLSGLSHSNFEKLNEPQILELEKFLPIFSICYTLSLIEINYLLIDYLFKEKNYLNLTSVWKITPLGWAHIESLQSDNPLSNIVFIAMKFEDKLKEFSEKWVEAAIRDAGYEPIRIDKHPHTDLIDDKIIANIRQSKFIIADLTGNSNGVYYESGFARGLSIPVIYLCQQSFYDKEKVHFDVNHYPILFWEYDYGQKLQEQLTNKILAKFGNGKHFFQSI